VKLSVFGSHIRKAKDSKSKLFYHEAAARQGREETQG